MKTKHLPPGCLIACATLFAGSILQAAPLVWFPGPATAYGPFSGAATVFTTNLGNIIIGGDVYPQNLVATNATWHLLAAISTLQIAPGASGGGDTIILYGGTDGTNSLSTVIGYSPSGDGNQTLASLNVARSYLGYATVSGGTPYAIGGLDADGAALASVETYNNDSNQWRAATSMPGPRYNFPAVFDHTNKIYTFGGYTDSAAPVETTDVLCYSTKTKTWTNVAPMPLATAGSCAAWGVDGNIYVVGGLAGGVATSVVQMYNPASNAWTISTPLPEALSSSAMGVDSLGRLIVMGGTDTNGNETADVWRSQQLGAPDAAPTLTQYPATTGTYLAQYSSVINATGSPPPVYSLVSGPVGMQVGYYTGAITWTPQADQIGTNAVTVRASNYAGFVDWPFEIVVPHPRPTSPTNLYVVSVTDTSVTLAWDPADPVQGTVTYKAFLQHVAHSPKGSGVTITYSQIGSNTPVPEITITGLPPGTAHTYYIAAYGPGGNSPTNATVAATTTAPQGPTNLVVTGLTSTSVTFSWSPSAGPAQNPAFSPVVSYSIDEWETTNSPARAIPTVTNLTDTSGTVTGLTPGQSHFWFVSAVDAEGTASGFGAVYVTVINPVPTPPQLSNTASISNGAFQFSGSFGASGPQTVLIQATTNPADPNSWTQIGSVTPTSSPFTFTDTNAGQFPVRYYRVVAP